MKTGDYVVLKQDADFGAAKVRRHPVLRKEWEHGRLAGQITDDRAGVLGMPGSGCIPQSAYKVRFGDTEILVKEYDITPVAEVINRELDDVGTSLHRIARLAELSNQPDFAEQLWALDHEFHGLLQTA